MPAFTDTLEHLDEADALLDAIRRVVRHCLETGAPAPELASTLVYVATEMSLELAPNPMSVTPVLLGAIAEAALQHSSSEDETDDNEIVMPAISPSGQTIH